MWRSGPLWSPHIWCKSCAAMIHACFGHTLTWLPPGSLTVHSACDRFFPTSSPFSHSFVKTATETMEDELMFSMEEDGSAKRPSAQRSALKHRASSLSESNASEDDDEDHFICPILDDSAKEVCSHLKNLVYSRQLSNSLPKSNFMYRVRYKTFIWQFVVLMHHPHLSVLQCFCLPFKVWWYAHACTHVLCGSSGISTRVFMCLLEWSAGQPTFYLNVLSDRKQQRAVSPRDYDVCKHGSLSLHISRELQQKLDSVRAAL